jgi:hypothetical protein
MKAAWSESRKLTTAATSLACPMRFIAVFAAIEARTSGGRACADGASIGPGATALMRTPRWAAERVRPTMPAESLSALSQQLLDVKFRLARGSPTRFLRPDPERVL